MNRNEHDIEPALRQTDALVARIAASDAALAREQPGSPSGSSLEHRIFASTRGILNSNSPVIARIGPGASQGTGSGMVWRLAAAVAIVGLVGAAVIAFRPAAPTPILAATGSAADLDLVLAAVSLLDEPLNGNFEQIAEDAARLHELVASDRSFSAEATEERALKQGV